MRLGFIVSLLTRLLQLHQDAVIYMMEYSLTPTEGVWAEFWQYHHVTISTSLPNNSSMI